MKNLMYRENRKSINAFVGCLHDCVYCRPSFQAQMKRQKNRCLKCYRYEPHPHLERLEKSPPKTYGTEFIFFPSSGDLAFASPEVIKAHLEYARKYSDRTFLIQTKNPKWLLTWWLYQDDNLYPNNVIFGTTIETNRNLFATPSKYKSYEEISKAPHPRRRAFYLSQFFHETKMVTIEPILDFDFYPLIQMLKAIEKTCMRLIIYVGYDNHSCHLPEPKLEKTKMLIEELEKKPRC